MDIKLLKLVSGEEVLCEITDRGKNSVSCKNPCLILPTKEGQLAIIPWMPYSKIGDGVEIGNVQIMFQTDVMEDMVTEYERIFSKVYTATPAETQALKLVTP